LAMWTSGVLATAISIIVGWPLFRRLVVETNLVLPESLATPDLARKLVEHRRNLALFDARSKELDARYTKVEDDFAVLTQGRLAIERERNAQDVALGMNPNEAKRWLLEFGPENSPFANGLRGALAGLAFAILLQLVTSMVGNEGSAAVTSWADLARRALSDP